MNAMRMYLVIVGVLLVGALGAVCYVWFVYQDVYTGEVDSVEISTYAQDPAQDPSPKDSESVVQTQEAPVVEPTQIAPSYTIDVATLPESQQAILKAFHGDAETITITSAMLTCARGKVGEVRLSEILQGSAPSPREALALAQCMK